MSLSPAQRKAVFDSIPCIILGEGVPVVQSDADAPHLSLNYRNWLVVTYLTEGSPLFYRGKGQLRKTWNADSSRWDIWDGEIQAAVLRIDVRSANKTDCFNISSALAWEINQNLLSLSLNRDMVEIGPRQIITVREVPTYYDEPLRHNIYRRLIEIELAYEVSFLRSGEPILTITNTMQIPSSKANAVIASDYYVMKAPKTLPAYMALSAPHTFSVEASMKLD